MDVLDSVMAIIREYPETALFQKCFKTVPFDLPPTFAVEKCGKIAVVSIDSDTHIAMDVRYRSRSCSI